MTTIEKDTTMTEAKHTPGPWSVSCVRTRESGEPVLQILGADGKSYAMVFYSDKTPALHAASYADANLIASAPALLLSLQHAVQIIRKYVPADALGMNSQGGGDGFNDQSWPILDEYLHYMDAAIAKATGVNAGQD